MRTPRWASTWRKSRPALLSAVCLCICLLVSLSPCCFCDFRSLLLQSARQKLRRTWDTGYGPTIYACFDSCAHVHTMRSISIRLCKSNASCQSGSYGSCGVCINRQTSIGDLIKLSFVAAENGDMMYNGQLPQPKTTTTTTTATVVVIVTTMSECYEWWRRQHIVLGTGMNGEPAKVWIYLGCPLKFNWFGQREPPAWDKRSLFLSLSFSLLLHNSPIKTKFFFVLFSFSIDKGWTEVSLSLVLSLGLLVHLQAARRLCRKSRVSLMQKIAKWLRNA